MASDHWRAFILNQGPLLMMVECTLSWDEVAISYKQQRGKLYARLFWHQMAPLGEPNSKVKLNILKIWKFWNEIFKAILVRSPYGLDITQILLPVSKKTLVITFTSTFKLKFPIKILSVLQDSLNEVLKTLEFMYLFILVSMYWGFLSQWLSL